MSDKAILHAIDAAMFTTNKPDLVDVNGQATVADFKSCLKDQGFAIVPRKPTGEMWSKGLTEFHAAYSICEAQKTIEDHHIYADTVPAKIYRAMITAYEDEADEH